MIQSDWRVRLGSPRELESLGENFNGECGMNGAEPEREQHWREQTLRGSTLLLETSPRGGPAAIPSRSPQRRLEPRRGDLSSPSTRRSPEPLPIYSSKPSPKPSPKPLTDHSNAHASIATDMKSAAAISSSDEDDLGIGASLEFATRSANSPNSTLNSSGEPSVDHWKSWNDPGNDSISGDVAVFVAQDDHSSVSRSTLGDKFSRQELVEQCSGLEQRVQDLTAKLTAQETSARVAERTQLARVRELELALKGEREHHEVLQQRCDALEDALRDSNARVDYFVSEASINLDQQANTTMDAIELDSLDSGLRQSKPDMTSYSIATSPRPSSPTLVSLIQPASPTENLPAPPVTTNRNLLFSPQHAIERRLHQHSRLSSPKDLRKTSLNDTSLLSASLIAPSGSRSSGRGKSPATRVVLRISESAAEVLQRLGKQQNDSSAESVGEMRSSHKSCSSRALRLSYSASNSDEFEDPRAQKNKKNKLGILIPDTEEESDDDDDDDVDDQEQPEFDGAVSLKNTKSRSRTSGFLSPRLAALQQAWDAELNAEQRFRQALLSRGAKHWDTKLLALWDKGHTGFSERERALSQLRAMSPRTRKVYASELAHRLEKTLSTADYGSRVTNTAGGASKISQQSLFTQIIQLERLYKREEAARSRLHEFRKLETMSNSKEAAAQEKALLWLSMERRKTLHILRANIEAWQTAHRNTFFFRGFDYLRVLELRYERDEQAAEERAIQNSVNRVNRRARR